MTYKLKNAFENDKKFEEKDKHFILKINKYIINEQKITMKVKIKKIKTIFISHKKRRNKMINKIKRRN